MLPVVELKEITHAYLGDREASLAIEDFNLSVGQVNSSASSGPAVAARRRCCRSLPGCCGPRGVKFCLADALRLGRLLK